MTMTPKPLLLCSVIFILLGSVTIQAQSNVRKAKKAAAPLSDSALIELQSLLREAKSAADQARIEARNARELNLALQEQLAKNTVEITSLKQTLAVISAQVTSYTERRSADSGAVVVNPLPPAPREVETLKSDLESIKEVVDVHTAQIKEHAQTKVESDTKFRVKLHGMLLANTFVNTNDTTLNDVPLFAAPAGTIKRRNNLGASLRQSRFGFTMDGPRLRDTLGGARISAEAEFDFWAGDNSEVLGQMRIITASARLDWEKTSLIVGQRPPLISPRNPNSLAAVWFAPFHQAGNLWQWRPQIMVEQRVKTGTTAELQFQGGVLMPFGETVEGEVIEGGAGYEARAVWSRALDADRSLEFGVGGYFHRRPFALERKVNSTAFTLDWQIPLGRRLELSGESYFGRAINLGEASGFRNDRLYAINGAVESPATQIRGVFSAGGWAQLNYKARSDLDFNLAYGQDDPRNADLRFGLSAASRRYKNQAASVNFIYSLTQNFLVSLEYRRLITDYRTNRQKAGHYNLAFGYTF